MKPSNYSSSPITDWQVIFELVSGKFLAAGVDCLLVGGWAVNYYGYTRNTLDIDFMIVSEQRDVVRDVNGMKFPDYPESAACAAVRSTPRLSMDDYVVFLADAMFHADPMKVARQKAVEKKITTPFRLAPLRGAVNR